MILQYLLVGVNPKAERRMYMSKIKRATPKIALSVRLDVETYNKLQDIKEDTGESANAILERLVKETDRFKDTA